MAETTPAAPDAGHDSRASARPLEPDRAVLRLLPPYALVLLLTAGLSVLVAAKGAEAWHAARGAGPVDEQVRRDVVFALVFAWSVFAALVAAWLGELLASAWRWMRGVPPGRVLARLALTGLPLLAFLLGQALVNPWLLDLGRRLRELASGPTG